jgi:hypothetical protein
MTRLKVLATVRPWSLLIAAATINVAQELGLPDMVITSGNDSQHKPSSKHYSHAALDFRTKHLQETQKRALRDGVKARLGRHFDVLLERPGQEQEHLHIEYDPKPAPQ